MLSNSLASAAVGLKRMLIGIVVAAAAALAYAGLLLDIVQYSFGEVPTDFALCLVCLRAKIHKDPQ